MNSTVPRFRYPAASAIRTAARPISPRSSSVKAIDGVSSMSFWNRRCTLHSRSNKWTVRPCPSAATWISTCLGSSRYFSRRRRPSPNEATAIRRGARGTDEDDPGLLAGLRERGILREESITRMDRVRGGFDRGVDDLADVQVRIGELRPSERDRLVGIPDERRVRIRVRIYGNRRDGEFAARPHDSHGDLPAVRDEDPVEHPSAERAPSLKSFSEVRAQEKTS